MSDIQFSFAKNSELIFSMGGRHLCSAFNPTKEAQEWVNRQMDRWAHCDAIVVLGLGCGYHVRALRAATRAEVVVVETNRSVIAAALRVHPLDIKEAEIVHFYQEDDLAESEALIRATRKPYCVLMHDPTVFLNREIFLAARRFVLGRTSEGLQWLFRNRQLPVTDDFCAEGAVTIKSLDNILEQGHKSSAPMLNAVRELII